MIEGIIIIPILWIVMSAIYLLLVKNMEGTKGISKEVYYGRKTGKQYTAERGREDYII